MVGNVRMSLGVISCVAGWEHDLSVVPYLERLPKKAGLRRESLATTMVESRGREL